MGFLRSFSWFPNDIINYVQISRNWAFTFRQQYLNICGLRFIALQLRFLPPPQTLPLTHFSSDSYPPPCAPRPTPASFAFGEQGNQSDLVRPLRYLYRHRRNGRVAERKRKEQAGGRQGPSHHLCRGPGLPYTGHIRTKRKADSSRLSIHYSPRGLSQPYAFSALLC